VTQPPLRRLRLRLTAPLGTPLTSGTLFGHLCWAIRARRGEAALLAWLDAQAEAPWILSDGFPAGLLPRPILEPSPAPRRRDVPAADAAKKRDRMGWITVGGFLATRDALSAEALQPHLRAGPTLEERGPANRGWGDLQRVRMAHNRIDRRRGTTPEEGGLFFVEEDWGHAVAPEREVYLRSFAPDAEVEELFTEIGAAGYGRDATWGRGTFGVVAVEALPELDRHDGPRRLSLSHGTIGANMADPRYRLFTHYGKVGDTMAATGARVWKRPLLLTRPGATFGARDDGPFGALLGDVHQDNAAIRHDARHLALPCRDAEIRS